LQEADYRMTNRSRQGTNLLPRAFLYWLPVALCATILSGLVYGTVQQDYRQSANDPQIEMAEDAAIQLQEGAHPQAVVGSGNVEMSRSLAPFVIVYDASGHVTASSAQLNGSTPELPPGVFDSVRTGGEDRLTWQPQEGVRVAAVVTQFAGSAPGFVLAGRSLREVEQREDRLTLMVGLAWLAALVGTFVAWLLALWLGDKLAQRPSHTDL
jgi:hypothetical protein